MIDGYNFNERAKRFEPIDTKCVYCDEKSENSNANSAFYQALFKEQDRTNIVVYRSVKYQKIQIGVPRCVECKKIHEKSKTQSTLCGIALFVLITAFSVAIFIDIPLMAGLCIFGAIAAGIFGAARLEDRLVLGNGIFPQKDGAENNSIVQTFILSGWSFEQPTA